MEGMEGKGRERWLENINELARRANERLAGLGVQGLTVVIPESNDRNPGPRVEARVLNAEGEVVARLSPTEITDLDDDAFLARLGSAN